MAYIRARGVALRRTAYHLCGDWHGADDLVQEAATRLYLNWGRVSEFESLDAYARKILIRVYLAQARRAWFRRTVSTAEPPERPLPAGYDSTEHLDLMAALDQLSAGQRAVVVLRYLEDQSISETARALRCSTGSVKSQGSRALARLRQLLPGYIVAAPDTATRS